MKRTYRLIKLRSSTVEDLMRLKTQRGKASLDELVIMMIRILEAKLLTLEESGWEDHSRR